MAKRKRLGRPPQPNPKNVNITIKVTQEMADDIERAAEKTGENKSVLVRTALAKLFECRKKEKPHEDKTTGKRKTIHEE